MDFNLGELSDEERGGGTEFDNILESDDFFERSMYDDYGAGTTGTTATSGGATVETDVPLSQRELWEYELAEYQERGDLDLPNLYAAEEHPFASSVAYLYEQSSNLFPAFETEMSLGDAAVPMSDVTGEDEQILQFPESRARTFNFLGLNDEERLKNWAPTPRRGVAVKLEHFARKFGTSNLLVLDARSPREHQEFSIKGSVNVWEYWNLDMVFRYLWRESVGAPRKFNLTIVVVGELSDLRATGLYRSIAIVDWMVSLGVHKENSEPRLTLSYPELYLLDGGMRRLAEEYETYSSMLVGSPSPFVSQFDRDTAGFASMKLDYFVNPGPETNLYAAREFNDRAYLFQLVRNPLAIADEFFYVLSYYSENLEEYRSAPQNPLLALDATKKKRQRIGEEINTLA